MQPREIFIFLVAFTVAVALARWFAARRARPKRVHYEDPLQQLEAEFPPEHRAEAKALIESIAAHATADQHAIIWRRTVDAVRGGGACRCRRAPKTITVLKAIYRLAGERDPADAG